MIYVILGLSILFIVIGFIVTENNAKYVLSGYNTMSEEERKKVDIKAYIPYFRKFHIFLGISLTVIGSILFYFFNPDWSGVFLGIYPILAYTVFIWKGLQFSTDSNRIPAYFAIAVLLGVAGLISYEYINDTKENEVLVKAKSIEISGSYGEEINKNDIKSIELVNELPAMSVRTNGVALETIKKGYFKTEKGEEVKLLINSVDKPIILITKKNNYKIYYSAKERSNEKIFQELKELK